MSQMHAIVIGAGIVGVCSALQLQRKGFRVTLMERDEPGAGASYGNASVLASESVTPISMPGIVRKVPGMLLDPMGPLRIRWSYLPRLAPWLWRFVLAGRKAEAERITADLAKLLDGCIEDFRPLLKAANAENLLVERGWIGAFLSHATLEKSGYATELQERHGVSIKKMTTNELRELEPALSKDIAGGYYYPGVAHVVDSHKLTVRLADSFLSNGGTLLKETAKDLSKDHKGHVCAVRTESAEHSCDKLVIAAGAWSRSLARKAGVVVSLDTERGYHFNINQPSIGLSRPVYVPETGLACTPLDDSIRLAGTVEFGGLEAPPDWKRAEVLASRGRELFPELDTQHGTSWMGFRPSMPDSLPVIGPATPSSNVYLAFGHGHLGLTLAARTGRMISEMACESSVCVDPHPYRSMRF
ncbi:MAG: NAD(P)/FAD-dependent oxidoreductase [Pseudomonadota bacterium]|uniref:NAD(P)/FAD-dependent oxidoreductase n=1 Tax=Fodinicurvata fenggangensis TaxID=1121830 RepID=UPI00055568D8|nr:FAD-binding oxidoreductase [Fodinicurvata fenggangensis]